MVEERNATELPLNGRNIYNLVSVAPSVVPQGNTNGSVVGKNPFDFANYQIGGSFANQSAEYLDGQPLNIGYINLPLLVPTQDSIGEFKVQYNNLGPEWGKFSGGVINLSTKSGTNTWHGLLYEYIRNNHLNANEWFNKKSEIANGLPNTPPAFHQNQFGGTIGGAIVKDRLFVFGSYEGFRLRARYSVYHHCSDRGRSAPAISRTSARLDLTLRGSAPISINSSITRFRLSERARTARRSHSTTYRA